MSRTPLFSRLRFLLREAHRSTQPRSQGRRRFMQVAAGGAALTVAACGAPPKKPEPKPEPKPGQPKIAIVGAGIAGLNCAWQLSKQNVKAAIFEAATRTGGRMYTKSDLLGPGLATELGGEFIDSGHEDMLGLCKEFGLELLDMQRDPAVADACYYFGGRFHTDKQIFEALKPLAQRIDGDAMLTGYNPERGRADAAYRSLDGTNLRDYLDAIGCTGWLRALIEVAFVTEYGLDPADQSCMNMLCLLDTKPGEKFEPFGESDERFKVRGGNERLCTALAEKLEGSIRLEHRLARIEGGKPFKLTFDTPRGAKQETADIVVMAIPFTILRELDVRVEMPVEKKRAIRQLGYGRNGKLVLGMESRPWRLLTQSGGIFSDEPFQLAWDNSRLQWGKDANPLQGPAGITLYSGGTMCDAAGMGAPRQQVEKLLPRLDKAFPGVQAAYNGKHERIHWPSMRGVLASYACYKPGQWTEIRGREAEPVGDLFFAGEHCSLDSQGYMNGGAETGRVAAEYVLARMPK